MNTVLRLFSGAVLVLIVAGCQTSRSLYYWGQYEPTLYQTYAKPGKVSVDEQILRLQEDLTKAAAAGLPAHPGLHAHLGYLYFSQGKLGEARKEFETEKAQFPESANFMDRMIQKLQPAAAS